MLMTYAAHSLGRPADTAMPFKTQSAALPALRALACAGSMALEAELCKALASPSL